MRKNGNPATAKEESASPGQSQRGFLAKYVQKNPVKAVGTAVIGLGAGFAIIFFFHVGYMPDMDWKSATGLLASIALVGLFFAIVLGIGLIAPGWAIRSMIEGGMLKAGLRLPLGSAVLAISTLGLATYSQNTTAIGVVLFTALAALGGPLGYFGWLERERAKGGATDDKPMVEKSTAGQSEKATGQEWAGFVMLYGLWIISSAAAFMPFATMYQGQGKGDADAWVALGLWLLFVAFSNAMWGTSKKVITPGMVLVNVALVLFALSIVSNNASAIPVSAVRVLGLGEIQNATLVVTKDACDVAKGAGVEDACKPIGGSDSFSLGPAVIRSRMGTEYVVLWPCPKADEGQQLIIKKEDVLGWSVPPKKLSTTECRTAAKAVEEKKPKDGPKGG